MDILDTPLHPSSISPHTYWHSLAGLFVYHPGHYIVCALGAKGYLWMHLDTYLSSLHLSFSRAFFAQWTFYLNVNVISFYSRCQTLWYINVLTQTVRYTAAYHPPTTHPFSFPTLSSLISRLLLRKSLVMFGCLC